MSTRAYGAVVLAWVAALDLAGAVERIEIRRCDSFWAALLHGGRRVHVTRAALPSAADLDKHFPVGQWHPFRIEGDALVGLPAGTRGAPALFLDGHGRVFVTGPGGERLKTELSGADVTVVPHATPAEVRAMLRDEAANRYDGFFNYPDYRQKSPGLFDFEGDLHLIRRWENYFARLEVSKEKKTYEDINRERHRAQDPARNGERIGSRPAILSHRFTNALHEVMREFPRFEPRFGPPPQWTPAAHAYLKERLWPLPVPSKLFVAMMPGTVSRFAVTGLEPRLEAYLIRNDSAPVFDNYGAWYHMYGMALFTIHNLHPVSTAVSEVEILGSRATSFRDRQEELSNRAGVSFGQALKQLVSEGRYRRPLPAGARTDYLNLVEFPRQPGS